MDDTDDTFDLRTLDALGGVDLTLWLRIVLVALALLVAGGIALL